MRGVVHNAVSGETFLWILAAFVVFGFAYWYFDRRVIHGRIREAVQKRGGSVIEISCGDGEHNGNALYRVRYRSSDGVLMDEQCVLGWLSDLRWISISSAMPAPPLGEARGPRQCPDCQTQATKTAKYCSECGRKL